MKLLGNLYKNIFPKVYFTLIFSALFIISCEEQVDDLWNADDDGGNVSPLVGDWYADSMSYYDDYYYYETWDDLMLVKNINDYNLWLLSDGSFQMVLDQRVMLKDDCEAYDGGIWNNSSGCSGTGGDVDYDPLEYCNWWFEFNQYNMETTECSQNVTLEGVWVVNEDASTLQLSMDSLCVNNSNDPSYIAGSENCENNVAEDTEAGWKNTLIRDFVYSIDNVTGGMVLDGHWFGDSTLVKFYLSM